MYTITTTSGPLNMNESLDSKYTVADILSSMASGDPLTPTYSGAAAVPTLASGVNTTAVSVTTPLLTPTTLANFEQTFAELQSVPTSTSVTELQAPQTFARTTESGFVPPVINMVKQEYVDYEYGKVVQPATDPDWLPPGYKRSRVTVSPAPNIQVVNNPGYTTAITTRPAAQTTPRRHTGPRPPRNDTNLSQEEIRKRGIRRERNKQAAAKCRQRRVDLTNTLLAETDQLEDVKAELENDIQSLQQQKEQLEFLLQAHKPVCHHLKKNGQVPIIKTEKSADKTAPCVATTVSAAAIPQRVATTVTTTRPNTLPLPTRTNVSRSPVTEATGVSITTPSSGVLFNFGLESMMDGHTGLTPLTGGPSCASQVQRNSSDSSPSEALSSPTTLMAL